MNIITINKKYIIYILIIILLITFTSFFIAKLSNKRVAINENLSDNNSYCQDNESMNEKNREDYLIKAYKNKKLIALTFDDGPSKYTEKLVNELNKRNVNATFFVIGKNVEDLNNYMKIAYDAGNEIAIHAYSHKLFTSLDRKGIEDEITKTSDLITKFIQGFAPSLIRVPYGSTNKKVDEVINNFGLTNIKWTVDSRDWKLRNTNRVYSYIMKNIKGNEIVLMHDIYLTSVEAAIKIVDTLQCKGYTFVTVSEFVKIKEMVENEEKIIE